jgi:hypothetical protein
MSGVKWKSAKRMESKFADVKTVPKKDFYAVASNGKKSYVLELNDHTLIQAKNESRIWAKSQNLSLEFTEVVRCFKQ